MSVLQRVRERLLEHADLAAALREQHDAMCALFGADRVTVYAATEKGDELHSILAGGIEGPRRLKLPVNATHSVAGYVAAQRRLVNLANAYDEAELAAFKPPLRFLREVDRVTGYFTRELLSAPVVGAGGRLLGVLQVLNRRDGKPFPKSCEESAAALCDTLAAAFGAREQKLLETRRRVAELLKAQAQDGMREDAPEAAALAREKLLAMYRARFADAQRLDIEWKEPPGATAWGKADLEGLAWLCRLAEARHAGAERLVERVLDEFRMAHRKLHEWAAFRELAEKIPRLARHLAEKTAEPRSFDVRELHHWLSRAGGAHAALAAELRELYRWPEDAHESDLVRWYVRHAGQKADAKLAPGLTVEIAQRRKKRSAAPPPAQAPVQDETQVKLDLAGAYLEMQDREGALEILREVLKEGDEAQRAQARELLGRIGQV